MAWSVAELRERLQRRRRLLVEFVDDASLKRVLQEDIADIERELDRLSTKSEPLPQPKSGT